jgi:anti-sigma B factor antagonist
MPDRVDTEPGPEPRSSGFGLVQRELDEHVLVISIQGELDLSTAPRLKWMLHDALAGGHDQLVLDLARTTFMDSTALGVLVAIRRKLVAGQQLTIVCATPEVLKIFEYSGMDGAFAIYDTLEQAVAAAAPQSARTG